MQYAFIHFFDWGVSLSRVLLLDMLRTWRSGIWPYPYDTDHVKAHRILSLTTGWAWRSGISKLRTSATIHRRGLATVGRCGNRSHYKQIWLNLRENNMGPTHVLCKSFGIEMALTSSRERKLGTESVAIVTEHLKQGGRRATIVMPDGPRFVQKKTTNHTKNIITPELHADRPVKQIAILVATCVSNFHFRLS